MKKIILAFISTISFLFLAGQNNRPTEQQYKAISSVIGQYSAARERSDSILLKNILTTDIDQLVSTGEWRNGINTAVRGMQQSSATSPGTRTLQVDKIRMLNATNAIVDCRYEIKQPGESERRMWSTFIVIKENNNWKITAIRNMLPAVNSQ